MKKQLIIVSSIEVHRLKGRPIWWSGGGWGVMVISFGKIFFTNLQVKIFFTQIYG